MGDRQYLLVVVIIISVFLLMICVFLLNVYYLYQLNKPPYQSILDPR